MPQFKISVIIPTRGRESCLRQVLRDLSAQGFRDFDVWVVDQNDVPLSGLDKEITQAHLRHEKMQPLGSHAGRNYAITRTSSELCVFIDDDVRLENNFLENHYKAHHLKDQSIGVIAGRVVQPQDGLSEDQMKKVGKLAKYDRWTGRVTGNFVGSVSGFVDHFHECNFSAKTKALTEAGMFNTAFTGNAYFEGTDLAIRIQKSGYKIFYDATISLIHLQEGAGGNRLKDKAKHTYWMMRNQSLLNSRHMNKLGLPLFEAYGISYVITKAIKNKNKQIAIQGLKGIYDGLKFFLK